jgi:hypothetical protein
MRVLVWSDDDCYVLEITDDGELIGPGSATAGLGSDVGAPWLIDERAAGDRGKDSRPKALADRRRSS